MRVVILGYTGLIGKCILEYLQKKNSLQLICVGKDIKFKPYKNSRIKYYKWDFTSFKKSNLPFLNKSQVIINCVGKTDGDKNKLNYINVLFVKKLLKHIKNSQLKIRLIHISSVSVYGAGKNNFGKKKYIYENSFKNIDDLYSKSKLESDFLISSFKQKNLNKNFSYTILRISNVFGGNKKTNSFKFLLFLLKMRLWIKCSNNITFNYINVKDVAQSVDLVLKKFKISKNKIYIVSDDCKQFLFYDNQERIHKKKFLNIKISIKLLRFIILNFPLPKKILNFILMISSEVFYSNNKIKRELDFNPKFSLLNYTKLK